MPISRTFSAAVKIASACPPSPSVARFPPAKRIDANFRLLFLASSKNSLLYVGKTFFKTQNARQIFLSNPFAKLLIFC
jgi:hypothetical protein